MGAKMGTYACRNIRRVTEGKRHDPRDHESDRRGENEGRQRRAKRLRGGLNAGLDEAWHVGRGPREAQGVLDGAGPEPKIPKGPKLLSLSPPPSFNLRSVRNERLHRPDILGSSLTDFRQKLSLIIFTFLRNLDI